MKLVLASASPRRKDLLHTAGLEFDVQVSDAPETIPPHALPQDVVMALAQQKAEAVSALRPADLVIGADTVVALDDQILGKPHNAEDAARMLRMLSGRTHAVYTGVCLALGNQREVFFNCTRVTFYSLTDEEIAAYVATGEPMDKAGAYGIQGRGCTLVRGIDGDYCNVVGLPVAEVCRKLAAFADKQ